MKYPSDRYGLFISFFFGFSDGFGRPFLRVEHAGFEPAASAMRTQRAPDCANAPISFMRIARRDFNPRLRRR